MTEFYWVLLAVALVVLFFVVGWAIDNYRELVRLRKTYDTKAEECVVIYEAMLSLIREFNKEELDTLIDRLKADIKGYQGRLFRYSQHPLRTREPSQHSNVPSCLLVLHRWCGYHHQDGN